MSHSKFLNTCVRFCLLLGISLITLSAFAQGSGGGKRLALVIGNDAYKNVGALKNARNDARLMTATLKKAGFDVT